MELGLRLGAGREGCFYTGKCRKCLRDRHGVSKNSRAESLMALGIIADVRGGGVLASALWLSRRPWSQARRMRAGEGYSVGGSEAGRLGSSS